MLSHILIKNPNINYILFGPMQKNNILNNSNYTKILYSTNTITLNGLAFNIPINNCRHYNQYNKYYLSFDNIPIELYEMISLEKSILLKLFPTKHPIYNIFSMIQRKQLNFFSHKPIDITNPFSVILKISGIWSNDTECGLTVRIYPSVITK
jgi:hypothetical protein